MENNMEAENSGKLFKVLGVGNEDEIGQIKGLTKLGLTQEDLKNSSDLFTDAEKQEKLQGILAKRGGSGKLTQVLGVTEEQILRRKAMDKLGVSESDIAFERQVRLSQMGAPAGQTIVSQNSKCVAPNLAESNIKKSSQEDTLDIEKKQVEVKNNTKNNITKANVAEDNSKLNDEDERSKLFKLLGVANQTELDRAKCLLKLGLTEDDMYTSSVLFNQPGQQEKLEKVLAKKGGTKKVPRVLGATEEQILRSKAVETLGITESEIDLDRQLRLSKLGVQVEAEDVSKCL